MASTNGHTPPTVDDIRPAHELKATPRPGVVELCIKAVKQLASTSADSVSLDAEVKGKTHAWCTQVKKTLTDKGYRVVYRPGSPGSYIEEGSDARMTVHLE